MVKFVRPLIGTDNNDKSLAGCQIFQLPLTGGLIEGQRLGKHMQTPFALSVCNIADHCPLVTVKKTSLVFAGKSYFLSAYHICPSDQPLSAPPSSKCSFQQDDYSINWTYDEIGNSVHFHLIAGIHAERFWTGIGFGDSMNVSV